MALIVPLVLGLAAGAAGASLAWRASFARRQRAEGVLRTKTESFHNLCERLAAGMCVVQGPKFVYANPRAAEIFGRSIEELLALAHSGELIAEEDRGLVTESFQARLANSGATPSCKFRIRLKNGQTTPVEACCARTDFNGKPALLAFLRAIDEREREEAVLKQPTDAMQTLSRRLLEMQEAERRHLSRELHDEIGQALTALKINLQAVQRQPDATASMPRLADSINIVDRTLGQVRNLSLNLRPSMLDDLGLFASLRWYADRQTQRAGLRVQFVVKPPEDRLDPMLETACFRVAQEALTNVVRHAQAQTVTIELGRENGHLHLVVQDDGVGFDPAQVRHNGNGADGSLGLAGMEERVSLAGGSIEFKSAPGSGTTVHAWFPVSEVKALPKQNGNGH